jgi:hypothetical protein
MRGSGYSARVLRCLNETASLSSLAHRAPQRRRACMCRMCKMFGLAGFGHSALLYMGFVAACASEGSCNAP